MRKSHALMGITVSLLVEAANQEITSIGIQNYQSTGVHLQPKTFAQLVAVLGA
jgi:hypothetical protein